MAEITPAERARLAALLEQATPGPWRVIPDPGEHCEECGEWHGCEAMVARSAACSTSPASIASWATARRRGRWGMADASTVIQSYVHRDGAAWFVSTIDRESSAALAPDAHYHETLVWTWDPTTRERGALIHMGADVRGSLREHHAICTCLYETGSPEVPHAG